MPSLTAQEFLTNTLLELSREEESQLIPALNMIALASDEITESMLRGYVTMAGLDYRDELLQSFVRTYIDAGCLSVTDPLGDSILNGEPISMSDNPEIAQFLDKLKYDQIFFKEYVLTQE